MLDSAVRQIKRRCLTFQRDEDGSSLEGLLKPWKNPADHILFQMTSLSILGLTKCIYNFLKIFRILAFFCLSF